MYYRSAGTKIKVATYTGADGNKYPNPQWFDGASESQLAKLGVTRHNDELMPSFNQKTQRVKMLDSGEYKVIELNDAEIGANKVVTVTMAQARLALLSAGLLSSIDDAIASMPSPQKEAAQIEWEYQTVVKKASPLVIGLTSALGMTSDDVDALFEVAAAL